MNSNLKHALHSITLLLFVALSQIKPYKQFVGSELEPEYDQYGQALMIPTTLIQCIVIISLPQTLFNFLGLILFNAFLSDVEIKDQDGLPLKFVELPHFCFRVVTRGLFPELVLANVRKNYLTCIQSGLSNFSIEVVTDKDFSLADMEDKVRKIVVPPTYRTSTGALFKARALQHALDPGVNILKEGDYIIHLDEETLITKNVINGIINFVVEGKHAFGQGLITYSNQEVQNWLTTLADSVRVADDMGKIRFQFSVFHKPLFGWKGSFVVTKYEAERDVSFDHGPDGSVAEDCYFSMVAFQKGYTFDFIQGEMWEKSPFSIPDLIKQRKRWIQGIWLVVHSPKIPIKNKILLTMSLYAWISLPITTLTYIVNILFTLPTSAWHLSIGSFCFAVTFYMYIFGVLKSSDLKTTRLSMLFACLIGQIFILPMNVVIEIVAVIWGLFGPKHKFYIVEKDLKRHAVLDP